MREEIGDLWQKHAAGAWVCVTTNGYVRRDGSAVMGRGVAKQAADRFPILPSLLGAALDARGNHVHAIVDLRIIAFPVKHVWYDYADVKLIERSAQELTAVLGTHVTGTVYLPRPGCGNGGLEWEAVRPILLPLLPDSVVVITLPERPVPMVRKERDESASRP